MMSRLPYGKPCARVLAGASARLIASMTDFSLTSTILQGLL
jgi:hypothetical protein